jgi:hypothetical protein
MHGLMMKGPILKVDFNRFTLEIKVSDGRLEVILNGSSP